MKINLVDDKYITPFFSEAMSYKPMRNNNNKINIKKIKKDDEKFIIGDVYGLSEEDCGEFVMPTKKYKLVGIINKANDIVLDSVIMKQIEGKSSLIFSLSKIDCKIFNIPFEQGLQLFPKKLDWVNLSLIERKQNEDKVKQLEIEKEENEFFDPCNLMSYPKCIYDDSIRHMVIKISHCTHYCNNGVLLPNGKLFKSDKPNLIIKTTNRLKNNNNNYNRYASFNENELINYKIITNRVAKVSSLNNMIDENDNLYLELSFCKNGSYYRDGIIGINPLSLLNLEFKDIIKIYSYSL